MPYSIHSQSQAVTPQQRPMRRGGPTRCLPGQQPGTTIGSCHPRPREALHVDAWLPTTCPSLLARLRRDPSNDAAWDEFVEHYGRHIYRWCRQWKLQDADAEDVAQEILLKLARKLRDFAYDPKQQFPRLAEDRRPSRVAGFCRRPAARPAGGGRAHLGDAAIGRGARRSDSEAGRGLRLRTAGSGQGASAAARCAAHMGGVPAGGHRGTAGRRRWLPKFRCKLPWCTSPRAKCRRCSKKKSRSWKPFRYAPCGLPRSVDVCKILP